MTLTKLNRNVFPIKDRVSQLESLVIELQQAHANIQLKPGRDGRDGRNGESIVGPRGESIIGPRGERGSDGSVGPAGADGRDGIDGSIGPIGPRGEKGERGDVCFIGPEELEPAIQKVRAELIAQRARFLAAVQVALEKNKTRAHHPTISRTVDAVLRKLKGDAGL